MASYQVLSWNEIPSQVRAEDQHDDVTVPLPPRFEKEIDRVAMERGAVGTDAYLEGWKWSESEERPGSAQEVAEAVRDELVAARPDGA